MQALLLNLVYALLGLSLNRPELLQDVSHDSLQGLLIHGGDDHRVDAAQHEELRVLGCQLGNWLIHELLIVLWVSIGGLGAELRRHHIVLIQVLIVVRHDLHDPVSMLLNILGLSPISMLLEYVSSFDLSNTLFHFSALG